MGGEDAGFDSEQGQGGDAGGADNTPLGPAGGSQQSSASENPANPAAPAGGQPEEPPIDPAIKAFDDFLLSEAVLPDKLLVGAAGSLCTTREEIARFNGQIANASAEEKPALEHKRSEVQKRYELEVTEFGTKLAESVKVDNSEIAHLCTKLEPQITPEAVANMGDEEYKKLSADERKKVDHIRKKQAALQEKQQYLDQFNAGELPPPAPAPQLAQTPAAKEAIDMESEADDKGRKELKAEMDPMNDPMNATLLQNLILLLISKNTPIRYIIAFTADVAARTLNIPLQAAGSAVCLIAAGVAGTLQDKEKGKEWLDAALEHANNINPWYLKEGLKKPFTDVYHMMEREQDTSALARWVVQQVEDRGMIDKATANKETAPAGTKAALQATGPQPTNSTNASLAGAPNPARATTTAVANHNEAPTTQIGTAPAAPSLEQRFSDLNKSAKNAPPPAGDGLSGRGVVNRSGQGMEHAAEYAKRTALTPPELVEAKQRAAEKTSIPAPAGPKTPSHGGGH